MALRGNFSQSFLRSKDLLSFSEISHDKDGNNILKNTILKEALARDAEGKLIRNKVNIAQILNKYGVIYRMVFNAMNMEQYTYNEVQEALDYLSEYINDLGVSGIVEFHAADKTQNSDHIHFWISSEEKLIYNKIAQEMVAMGCSNREDVYIQKYEDNNRLNKMEYVNNEECSLIDRFSLKPTGRETGETINSINKMLSVAHNIVNKKSNSIRNDSTHEILKEQYMSVIDNISNLLKKVVENNYTTREEENKEDAYLESTQNSSFIKDSSLPKTEETNSILSKIEKLRRELSKK
jgi:kynurenine formamidase